MRILLRLVDMCLLNSTRFVLFVVRISVSVLYRDGTFLSRCYFEMLLPTEPEK